MQQKEETQTCLQFVEQTDNDFACTMGMTMAFKLGGGIHVPSSGAILCW